MSDRTPERVVEDGLAAPFGPVYNAEELAAAVVAALRAEGKLVEEGEVKVRLDEWGALVQGYALARSMVLSGERNTPVAEEVFAAATQVIRDRIAARVVRGETQEADRG